MKIYAKCMLRNKVLDVEEYLTTACSDWKPFDSNLALLSEIPEINEKLESAKRCWNCKFSMLFLEGLYSNEDTEGEGNPEPTTEAENQKPAEE
ncbi:MAG: hypothetical protein JHC38_08830 [Thiotrichales bacterium]|jgi:hypothetical protein|nr:hypothetical protein [Thiotrichales bacterium]